MEDKIDPVREGRTHGRQVFQVTRNTPPGALTGIDTHFYVNAYPVTAVVYGLYPIRVPNHGNLQPLRVGDLNCVAQRVMEHFEGALRGHGLTETRRRKITEWEEEVHDRGATVDDVANLEKILKRPIVLQDIAGESIYDSKKYRHTNRVIELIYHNGHAWNKDLHFPIARKVQIYDGDMWQAIQRAMEGEPMTVWLLGGGDRQLDAKLIDQFVLQDGHTFRREETHKRFEAVCEQLLRAVGETHAEAAGKALADRVFGENHAAAVVAKEKNSWKPTSASALDDVQNACVEHGKGGLWNTPDGYDREAVVSIDMKSCYPASFQGLGECAPWFARFGHPRSGFTRVAINGSLPETKDLTGFAQVRQWTFNPSCHPVIPAWFGKHFEEKGWASIVLLTYMQEADILTSLEVTEAIVSFEKQTDVWLPEDRNQGCGIIGKFTQGAKVEGKRMTRRLVTDPGELDFLVRDCAQAGILVGPPPALSTGPCPYLL